MASSHISCCYVETCSKQFEADGTHESLTALLEHLHEHSDLKAAEVYNYILQSQLQGTLNQVDLGEAKNWILGQLVAFKDVPDATVKDFLGHVSQLAGKASQTPGLNIPVTSAPGQAQGQSMQSDLLLQQVVATCGIAIVPEAQRATIASMYMNVQPLNRHLFECLSSQQIRTIVDCKSPSEAFQTITSLCAGTCAFSNWMNNEAVFSVFFGTHNLMERLGRMSVIRANHPLAGILQRLNIGTGSDWYQLLSYDQNGILILTTERLRNWQGLTAPSSIDLGKWGTTEGQSSTGRLSDEALAEYDSTQFR